MAQEEAAIRAASQPRHQSDGERIDISPGVDIDWVDLKNRVVSALDDADDLLPYGIEVTIETDGRVVLGQRRERQRPPARVGSRER